MGVENKHLKGKQAAAYLAAGMSTYYAWLQSSQSQNGETMTTKVTVLNDHDSNKAQHARVTFERPGQDPAVRLLAPGESTAWWISGNAEGVGDKITVVEVFAPKPTE